jgi:hypothetical protein
MVVLAFLTDPEVVRKILAHLGLPTAAPVVAKARSSAPALGFDLPEMDCFPDRSEGKEGEDSGVEDDRIRPPP